MISYFIEIVLDVIIMLFRSQRWYLAILYALALLSLIASTVGGLGYLVLWWLFRSEDFGRPLTIIYVAGACALLIALWVAFVILTRKSAAGSS